MDDYSVEIGDAQMFPQVDIGEAQMYPQVDIGEAQMMPGEDQGGILDMLMSLFGGGLGGMMDGGQEGAQGGQGWQADIGSAEIDAGRTAAMNPAPGDFYETALNTDQRGIPFTTVPLRR